MTRQELEKIFGKDNVWNTEEVIKEFEILTFSAPYCIARKISTGEIGSLLFQHRPRFYFNWILDK